MNKTINAPRNRTRVRSDGSRARTCRDADKEERDEREMFAMLHAL